MKVFILSDLNSTHTKRWVSALVQKEIKIYLFGLQECRDDYYADYSNVTTYGFFKKYDNSVLGKLKYLTAIHVLKQKIADFQPDILHAHYASSYGLLGALSNFQPFIISIWGSDVYDFPNKSLIHKKIIKHNLNKANQILSTSHIMAREAEKYTNKSIEITPFGVDVKLFKKLDVKKDANTFVVGNVKALFPEYGIDDLIRSFAIVKKGNPEKDLQLKIVGDGPKRVEYENLVAELSISEIVEFVGRIDNQSLPEYYNAFSVAVSLSHAESFGVVAVEAMACECPVITSDADGFTEVVKDGETGLIVPKNDVIAAANAIQKLIENPDMMKKFGENGRIRVLEHYNWKENVDKMYHIYKELV